MFDFLKIKKSVADLSSQVAGLKAKIEGLKRRREDVSTSAANKADIKAALTRVVEQRAAEHQDAFGKLMDNFRRRPDSVANPTGMAQTLLVGVPAVGVAPSARSLEAGLCAVLGDAVLAGLLSQVDTMDWPGEGLPMAERTPLLAKLDREIGELERELSELNASARAAGIFIE